MDLYSQMNTPEIITMRSNKLSLSLSLSVALSSLFCFWRVTSAECASLISLDISLSSFATCVSCLFSRLSQRSQAKHKHLDLWNLPLSSLNKAAKGTNSSYVYGLFQCAFFWCQIPSSCLFAARDIWRRCCLGMHLLSSFVSAGSWCKRTAEFIKSLKRVYNRELWQQQTC